ncbi:MAG: UDP-2,4-diacetamido-2,4,6-trideoxy-beta-L-altropyranose hydrolase [Crocinitomicaceae bacterium]|nr:UDP-2,4-diacetamido-2,4,6-trideoxy-beta-L-altropyranose hydrolase [Crocinitomicaceae bacterium]MBK8924891.1 UDP-2,4-diacetamido-2,4,6-trideoxy-beta-L-altropyranose hydrolase [Crocinitomicaceae bacterium]
MINKTQIVFRCDGNSTIGLGHLYRSLALAEFIENHFSITFLTKVETTHQIIPDKYKTNFIPQDFSIEQEIDFIFTEYQTKSSIFVIDGYQFTQAYIESLCTKFKVVYLDDVHTFKNPADLIINHAGGLDPLDIYSDFLSRKCLGTDYVMLRKDFLRKNKFSTKKFDVLICFGGADPDNYTCKTIAQLDSSLNKIVVLGSAFKYAEQLEKLQNQNCKIIKGATAYQMAELMQQTAFAITSASTVSLEFLACSDGCLYLIQTADNQKFIFNYLISYGVARKFEGQLDFFNRQKELIDGNSPERLLKEFVTLEYELGMTLRYADQSDIHEVYNWVNDAEVRKQSYLSDPIPFDTHSKWYMKKISDDNSVYFIALFEEIRIGQIRFDIEDSKATISYLLSPSSRGKGFAQPLLKLGIKKLLKEKNGIKEILGYVKTTNSASCKSFKACNFNEEKTTDYPDSFLYRLKL